MHWQRDGSGKRWSAPWTHGGTQVMGLVVRCFGTTPGDVPANIVPVDAASLARSAAELAAALHEDSNMELDWLWYATNMTSTAQRRICLQHALHINPHSEDAKRMLVALVGDEPACMVLAGDVAVVSTSADATTWSSV